MGSLIGGLIALILGVWGLATWPELFVKALKAAVPFLLVVGGAIAIFGGITSIKDRIAAKREEEKAKREKKEEEEKKEERKEEGKEEAKEGE